MAVPVRTTTTTCAYCGVGCTLELHSVNDQIFKATSPTDAVVNQGQLCVKGRFGFDYVQSPDRLTTPLIRRGGLPGARRGSPEYGTLEPASWDEALDLVARRLNELKAVHGPNVLAGLSSAKCTNEENYLFQKLMRAAIGTNNVDHCARLCHASSVVALNMALGSASMSNSIDEVRHVTDCMLVTGHNTTENHPVLGLAMKAAVARGAKLILIDPRRIELADFATYHLQPKSGTNVAVYNALAHVIIAENLVNRSFIERMTEGYEAVLEAVRDCTPEWCESVSGVPADLLRQAARLYATSPAAGIFWGMGVTQHHNGVQNALSLVNLALLTGQVGRPGTGVNPVRGQNNVQGAGDMGTLPNLLPGYVSSYDAAQLQRVGEIWGATLPSTPGLTSTDAIYAMGDHKVKGLFIMGENPLVTDPNLNHTRVCFEELEFLAVQDIFLSETAALADVVLPATAFAEKEGTFTNTERRVQRVRKAVPAPGQARPDWQILADLSTRLGFPMHYENAAQIWAEVGRVWPVVQGITWDRLEAGQGIQWPCPDEQHPGTQYLFATGFPRGKGKFHATRWEPPTEQTDAEYPYLLSTGRVLFHWHSGVQSRRSEGLDAIAPEALVELNPADAAHLGIADASMITVASRRGSLTAKALLSRRPLPGTIFMTFHYVEAAANLLTIDSLDPLAKIPEFKVCAVKLEPAR